jgi:AcrR family transcriptional regulator
MGHQATLPTEHPNRRERLRASTIQEIKSTALTLMEQRRTTDIRFADIAREMGVTAPALYRYFADRDQLLTAMIFDGYAELARCLAASQASLPVEELGERWRAVSASYRDWAHQNPQRFALLFGLPIPGYTAPADGTTTDEAHRAMANLTTIVIDAMSTNRARPPIITQLGPALTTALEENGSVPEIAVPALQHQAMLHAWALLHGFTSLDVYGQLHWLGDEAREELFLNQVRLGAHAMGIPAP